MLQADEPDTFVLATNRTETVRDFVRMAFKGAGITVDFRGLAEGETAVDTATGKTVMKINPKFYRPAEVELLIGNPAKAKAKLGWEPQTTLEQLSQGERELKVGQTVMRINPKFYRPAEVALLIGNPAKAKAKLGWEPKTTLEQLCQMMVEADLRRNQQGFSF
jgi:GDPmannose 4,6-dehydratase